MNFKKFFSWWLLFFLVVFPQTSFGQTSFGQTSSPNYWTANVSNEMSPVAPYTYVPPGMGDVVGPASATDHAFCRYDLTTGKLIQDSPVTSDDNGSVNIPTGETYDINGTPLAVGDITNAASSGANTDITSLQNTAVFVGRDTDNRLNWGTDDQLDIVIGGVTSSISSVSTGVGDNDKLVSQGYVDDLVGSGDVVGPASATDSALALFDTTTGKLLKNSVGTLDSTGLLEIVGTQGRLILEATTATDPSIAFRPDSGAADVFLIGIDDTNDRLAWGAGSGGIGPGTILELDQTGAFFVNVSGANVAGITHNIGASAPGGNKTIITNIDNIQSNPLTLIDLNMGDSAIGHTGSDIDMHGNSSALTGNRVTLGFTNGGGTANLVQSDSNNNSWRGYAVDSQTSAPVAGRAFTVAVNGSETYLFKAQELSSSATNVVSDRTSAMSRITSSRNKGGGGTVDDDYDVSEIRRFSIASSGIINSAGAAQKLSNSVDTSGSGVVNDITIMLEMVQDSDSTGDIINAVKGATEVFVIEDGGAFNPQTGDPCPTRDAGYFFYNATSGYNCFCDNVGDDLKTVDNTTACF